KDYLISASQGDFKYTSGGTYSYAKFGFSMGAQWAITKFIHVGMEYGGYVANNSFSTTTGVGDFGQKYYSGLFGKYFLVCQLGPRK
ncbi:MAG: hypothetical protein ACKO5W_02810, partial [Crocinitomicaceae bacterium]